MNASKKMVGNTMTTSTVGRVLLLLGCFGEQDEWTIGALAARLSLPKSTTHRLVALCRDYGFIESCDTSSYRAGVELCRVSSLINAQNPMLWHGKQLLRQVAHECGEVAVLAAAIPERLTMTYLAKAEPSEDFRYHIELNVHTSLCWGACGRVILAHLDLKQVDSVIAGGIASPSGAKLDETSLRENLQEIRTIGYCISIGQNKETAVGVAVPVFGPRGEIRAAMGVSVPTFRFSQKAVPNLLTSLRKHAKLLAYNLGGEHTSQT